MSKEKQSSSQSTTHSSKTRLCYSKETMLTIRESTPSRTRPSMLSPEFDNDDGLFSPDKWIQHFWQCEGIGNRVIIKKRTNTTTGKSESSSGIYDMDIVQAVLSPQRKAFLSGCKAASPKPDEERPGSKTASSGRWRHGHLSNGGVDFKPAFQKNALDSRSRAAASSNGPGMAWRSSNNTDETRARHFGERSEQMPEWLDEGPSSMTDVIELKGFEDDEPRDRKKVSDTIEEKRPESKAETSNAFPTFQTDEEFAAIMGILDVSDTSSANRSITRQDSKGSLNPPSSSRLTRFFSKNQNTAEENTELHRQPQLSPLQQILKPTAPRPIIGHPRETPESAAAGPQQNLPPALQQLFASVPQKIPEPSRAMTVEELERATLGSLSQQVQNGASSSGQAVARRDHNRVMTVEELERNTLRTLTHQPQGGLNGPNPYLQAQMFQAQMQQSQMHQPQMQPNLFQHVPIPRDHNRVMTVEELERNTLRTLTHQPQGGLNGPNPYLQAQMFQAQMQQQQMHPPQMQQPYMQPNLLQHVPVYSIPQVFQSGLNGPNPYLQAQMFQAQMQQSHMHQSHMHQNLLQQVPIPVLQKVFAANSPTNPSSPPAAKFKSP
ncbi:nucleocytoplasmic shuttling protein for mRNA cap-binding EIF4E domain-containing protein [Ditylenchus destructor]|uniref:Nucleocytoplasmic shuttling protein for mRNA cap-binding EIF4E domain-containing protein n=1 Tax=Ditylenchus destructor TaxID=166010 RepID=A0AAD4R0B5_9BILA|nr:nucleocytoplasmic shuttling protein for mRNA cap-binding EIF4E domain-containing protein [Ditylenchus destructor]